jgi:NADPH:quinone reductase-like Zn-dependent oxidoreductase
MGHYLRALRPGGVLSVVGGPLHNILKIAAFGRLVGRRTGKRMGLLLWRTDLRDLEEMTAMFEVGLVQPVIERVYSLDDVAEAMRHLGAGRALGKLVIEMVPEGSAPGAGAQT